MAEINETSINNCNIDEWLQVFTSEKKFLNRIKKYQEQYPDKVKVIAENKDGSMLVHLPKEWFVFPKPPAKRSLTEEQKKALSDRMHKIHSK